MRIEPSLQQLNIFAQVRSSQFPGVWIFLKGSSCLDSASWPKPRWYFGILRRDKSRFTYEILTEKRQQNFETFPAWKFSTWQRSALLCKVKNARAGLSRDALTTQEFGNWTGAEGNDVFYGNGENYACTTYDHLWELFNDAGPYKWNMWVKCRFSFVMRAKLIRVGVLVWNGNCLDKK